MNTNQIDALLSQIYKIEKSFLSELSHVKADLLAIRDDVAIVPARQPKPNQKELEAQERKDRIRRSYK